MELADVMQQLESLGTEQCRRIYANHGAPLDAMFGVKTGDLRKLQKKIKVDHALALQLYATGNADAQYLAGMVADAKKAKKAELDRWAKDATWFMVSEYCVAGVAADSPHGWELGLKWIDAKADKVASAGWNTLAGWLAVTPDEDLDIEALRGLLARVERDIHAAGNRTRYTMNGFVISLGGGVPALLKEAKAAAKRIGKVHVEQGTTGCKVPFAPDYIAKIESMGRVGKKRKSARC